MAAGRYNPHAMTDPVIVENSGGVLTLTLNRPDKKNALTTAMYEVLTRALDDAAEDASVGCVLIQGNGDSYVTADARLSVPFVNLALVPEAASSLLLPARIGHARAFAMFVLGEAIDGPTAVAWGIANELVAPDNLRPRARTAAEAVAARPRQSVRQTRRLLRNADALAARIAEENEIFAAQLRSAGGVAVAGVDVVGRWQRGQLLGHHRGELLVDVGAGHEVAGGRRSGCLGDRRVLPHGRAVVTGDDAHADGTHADDGQDGEAQRPTALPAPSAALLDRGLEVGSARDVLGGAVELVADDLLSGHGGFLSMDSGVASTPWRRSRARAVWLLTVPSGRSRTQRHLGDGQVVEVAQGDDGPGPRRQPGQGLDQVEPIQPAVGPGDRPLREPVGRRLAAPHLGHPEARVHHGPAGVGVHRSRLDPRPVHVELGERRLDGVLRSGPAAEDGVRRAHQRALPGHEELAVRALPRRCASHPGSCRSVLTQSRAPTAARGSSLRREFLPAGSSTKIRRRRRSPMRWLVLLVARVDRSRAGQHLGELGL